MRTLDTLRWLLPLFVSRSSYFRRRLFTRSSLHWGAIHVCIQKYRESFDDRSPFTYQIQIINSDSDRLFTVGFPFRSTVRSILSCLFSLHRLLDIWSLVDLPVLDSCYLGACDTTTHKHEREKDGGVERRAFRTCRNRLIGYSFFVIVAVVVFLFVRLFVGERNRPGSGRGIRGRGDPCELGSRTPTYRD